VQVVSHVLDFFEGILSEMAGKVFCLVEIDFDGGWEERERAASTFGSNADADIDIDIDIQAHGSITIGVGGGRGSDLVGVHAGLKCTRNLEEDEQGSDRQDVPQAMCEIVNHNGVNDVDNAVVVAVVVAVTK